MSSSNPAGRGLPRFLLGRLAQGLLVVLGVTTIVFIVTRLVGDPIQAMLPVDASAADRAVLAQALGMDGPIWSQSVSYTHLTLPTKA